MRQRIAVLIFTLGIILSCYIGGWMMFISPIIHCCKAYDTGTLTGMMIGVTVLKCIFAGGVAGAIIMVTSTISIYIGDKE